MGAAVGRAGAVAGPVLTLSAQTGTDRRAEELGARHPTALTEAMEGAGVATAALRHGLPVSEVRTVSNLVGRRDESAWDKPVALDRLARAFAALLGGPLALPTHRQP